MRIAGIVLNVGGAILLFLAGRVAQAIHATHSFSVTRELEKRAGLDGSKVSPLVEGDPRLPDGTYDTHGRIRSSGDVEWWLAALTGTGAVLLLLNAVAWWAFGPRPNRPSGSGSAGVA